MMLGGSAMVGNAHLSLAILVELILMMPTVLLGIGRNAAQLDADDARCFAMS